MEQVKKLVRATYARLRDGSWGMRVQNASVQPGTRVLMEKANGTSHEATVGEITVRGRGYTLARITHSADAYRQPAPRPAAPAPAPAPVAVPKCAGGCGRTMTNGKKPGHCIICSPKWPDCKTCGKEGVGVIGVTGLYQCRKCEVAKAFDTALEAGERAADERRKAIEAAFLRGLGDDMPGVEVKPSPAAGIVKGADKGSVCASEIGLRPGHWPTVITVAGVTYYRGSPMWHGVGDPHTGEGAELELEGYEYRTPTLDVLKVWND